MVVDAAEDGVATVVTIQDLHPAMVDAGADVVVEEEVDAAVEEEEEDHPQTVTSSVIQETSPVGEVSLKIPMMDGNSCSKRKEPMEYLSTDDYRNPIVILTHK